jgi:hypothetical protein
MLFPAVQDEADKIVEIAVGRYTIPVDRKELHSVVEKALGEGIPFKDVYTFVAECSAANRETDDVALALKTVAELQKTGVDTGIVINSILEGIAKDVPGPVFKKSLIDIENNIKFSAEIASFHATRRRSKRENEMALLTSAVLNTLNSGYNPADIRTISLAIKNNKLNAGYFTGSLQILMELNSFSIPRRHSVDLVEKSIDSEFDLAEMQAFLKVFQSEMKEGVSEEEIYKTLLDQIESRRNTKAVPAGGKGSGGRGSSSPSTGPGHKGGKNSGGGAGGRKSVPVGGHT